MSNWGWVRGAGKYAGPIANIGFGVWDYADGKAQGEDNIRAASGAVGSTAGGIAGASAGAWAGGTAGTGIGAAIGSVIPGPGTIVGAGIGGAIGTVGGMIAGGMGGNFLGGWGADRVDEGIRGNKGVNNMATFNQGMEPYNYKQQQQEQNNNWGLIDYAALAAGGYGAASTARNVGSQMGGINPAGNYQFYRQQSVPRVQAAGNAIRDAASLARKGVAAGWRNTPLGAKVAGGVALAYGANKILGNPVGGVADAVTGNIFDFDGKGKPAPSNTANSQRDQRSVNEVYSIPNYENPLTPEQVAKMNSDEENIKWWRNMNYTRDMQREGDERFRRRRAMEIRAEQAQELGRNFSTNIPNSVANQVQAIFMGGMVK